MTYQRIVPAELAFANDGVPYSAAFDDVYHSASGGLEQARHVFLAGNRLIGEAPRWRRRECFTVLETGFGAGLNFLATWQAWRDDPARPRRLHFVSVEKHPYAATDLRRIFAGWPALADLSSQLADVWPALVPGLHRLHFENGAVTLTLAFGDAAERLPQLVLAADAIYLDGFAPAKNPDMWSDAVFAALFARAAPGATLASWSVLDDMMFRLSRAGFALEKRPGFGTKRYMLAARKPGETPDEARLPQRIAVIGAGAAGSSAAQRLAARGFDVAVFEAAAEPAQGASGNTAGVFRPLPSLDDSRLARLLRAGFLYGRRHLAAVPGVRHQLCGVLHIARDAKHEETQRRIVAEQVPPADLLRFVERDEASAIAGWPVEMGAWWFPGGGWINPPSLCRANLAGLDVRYGAAVDRLEAVDGGWRLLAADGSLLGEADAVVLANATDARRMIPELPVRVGRGLVSHIPEAAVPPFNIVATRLGYVTPAVDGIHCAGATMASGDTGTDLRLADHVENLTRLDMTLPGYGKGLDPAQLAGRIGFRPMSPDRLPIVGALDAPGLWTLNGFGARGLVWASLCAELLACRIAGEPLPVEADIAAALSPGRFRERSRRRGKV
ncbi:MAG: bifunctional tRNA (5-methylaminomethyl-2-thiouridine)(34)-methyltransferase MnmD/FAD-dependent 5-carboxymethylaminomethyl-2-thiouridine(34) oxidoreductase MnmC [Sterolibacteriaceae bacterium MAG5]|nr:bifunctional tRNA (5-methylaminomethyl-2-thiouridine)(34)-methyltransferase MnmD/FAD-dependent 5-carboxymethylaminomethyl-2-thiouridine(34) oxidoreductase MnmC [Candidatus Nitricoxidireducens bremensis]